MQPTPAQQAWTALEFGMFIHFGLNTFHDVEWSDGTLDPSAYDPQDFTPDAWCQVARSAGMRFVVLVAKHHDGFCNWPTRKTDYNVRSTPFGRDVVGEVAAAARRAGLRCGLYYSLWDRHEPSHDSDAEYTAYMRDQISELLTNYGEIVELWFDGMWVKMPGPYEHLPPEGVIQMWREQGAPRWHWDELYAHIKRLQPDCLVLNNSTVQCPGLPLGPVDARSGEKAAHDQDRVVWTIDGQDVFLPMQMEFTLSAQGRDPIFADGNWFWHEWDHSVRTDAELLGLRRQAHDAGRVLLLNVGPSSRGTLRPEDVGALTRLGAAWNTSLAQECP